MKKTDRCPECGAKVVEYHFLLNRGLIQGLEKLANKRECELTDLGLTNSQYSNFPKLAYWGLVETDGKHTGYWKATKLGYLFLEGRVNVPRGVWTYRGEVTRMDKDLVRAGDVIKEFKYRRRSDYILDAQPMLF
jgi:hypothetical protein